MRSSQKNQCFFMEAQRMLSKSFLAWTLRSKRRTVSVLISSTFCDSMLVNFFLTSVSWIKGYFRYQDFTERCPDYWCWKSKVNQYVLSSFNSLRNGREFSVTLDYFVGSWYKCQKEDRICFCFFTLLKIWATASCACYFIYGLGSVEVIISDSVLWNGNVIR
jgi:hypothetical protein